MLVLGIDFESTGLDTREARITEVGAVLFDYGWEVMGEISSLVYESNYEPLTEEITAVTGITDEMLKESGRPFLEIVEDIIKIASKADYILAHNREYDRGLLIAEILRAGIALRPDIVNFLKKPWLCSVEDMEHSERLKCRKLSHMALDYGVPVDPSDLHRAVGDVRLMGRMIKASAFPLEKMIALSETPWVYVRVFIPAPWTDNEKGKNAAQARGFRWQNYFKNGPSFDKSWVKRIKKDRVQEETEALPDYKVSVIHTEELKNGIEN